MVNVNVRTGDVCRWMCPTVYGRKGIKSAVVAQPKSEAEKLQAYAGRWR